MRLFDEPTDELVWERASLADVNPLLVRSHYLGPARRCRYAFAGWLHGECVAAQVWAAPTSRKLPSDGSWLELARWCLTPDAGKNAGSRQHAFVVRWLRENDPIVTTLVSYSDPSVGHTGSLYRACNWLWRPTWMRLRPPPSAGGSWDGVTTQAVKDRWMFPLRPDAGREGWVAVDDAAAIRHWEASQVSA